METVRVKPAHPSQGEFVVINKKDFDPSIHQLYGEPEPPKKRRGRPPKEKEI